MSNERGGGEGVFNRFTQSGREAVSLSGSEAKGLGHNYLGTEHLLLGVLNTELGTHVLGRLGLTLEVARSDVVERVGSVPESDREATAALPSTPRTMDVLVVAWQEARFENDIGSEHILLALLREGQGVAAYVLSDRGISEEQVRSELRRG